MHIGTVTNTEDGLQAVMDQVSAHRYRVIFRDIDADETVGTRFYSTHDAARDEATRFVRQWEQVNATRRAMKRVGSEVL